MGGRRTRTAVGTATVLAVLGWVEWTTWRASRDALPTGATDASRVVPGETVLVLGCPLPILHRWRVRIAVRSTNIHTARFVFSGGAVRGPVPEARMLADYAMHTLGVPEQNVVLEDRSRTTVENIANSMPWLADAPAIKIASNTFHARRARRILRDHAPDLAARMVRARDYVPVEWGLLHALMIVHEALRDGVARRRAGAPGVS